MTDHTRRSIERSDARYVRDRGWAIELDRWADDGGAVPLEESPLSVQRARRRNTGMFGKEAA